MKIIKKYILAIATVLLAACFLTIPTEAAGKKVKNPTKVTLKANKTYDKYDVTGDGRADTIKIRIKKDEYDTYYSLKIAVNEKTRYEMKEEFSSFWDYEFVLYTLKNGKPFLSINTYLNNGDGPLNGLFQYKSGKMKQVADFNTFLSGNWKYGYHSNGRVLNVKGNSIYTEQGLMGYTLGVFDVEIRYEYKAGTLRRSSNNYKFTFINGDGKSKNLFKTGKKLTVYKSASAKKKAFTVKTGKYVRVTKCYHNGKVMRYKIKYGNKYGWIKAETDKQYDWERPLFSNVMLAG